MNIGEIAAQCGLRASAIRYYEQAGLLPRPPRAGGRRVYGPEAVNRLAVLPFAQEVGFSIAEIKVLCQARPLSDRFRRLAQKKIEEVDRLIERAAEMKRLLMRSLRCQCLDTEECGSRIRQNRGGR